jgi:putative transposase
MIVLEYKIKAKQDQLAAIDEAIRTGQFVRNKALRYWMDNKGVNKYDLNKYCRVLAKEYVFADKLNSTAREPVHYYEVRTFQPMREDDKGAETTSFR